MKAFKNIVKNDSIKNIVNNDSIKKYCKQWKH